jgi:hypothetical protein
LGTYFRTDTTQLTYGELWRLSSSWLGFLGGCVNKLLGIQTPARYAVWHEARIEVIDADWVPPAAREVLEPIIEEAQRLGARWMFYQTVPALGNLQGYAAVLLCAERNAVFIGTWSQVRITRRGRETTGSVFVSQLHDGTLLSTTNHRRRLDTAPEIRVERWLGAPVAELADKHRRRLNQAASPPLLLHTEDDVKELLVEAKERNFGWNVSRGVYLPLTEEEYARLRIAEGERC